MTQKLETAKKLYLRGIRDGEIAMVDECSGGRYTQHSTGVKDGPEGFKEFFKGFLERTSHRDIQIIRAIEDGSYVFLQVYQNIDNGKAQWITTDMFDTDRNDKLVEHWDVISPYIEPSKTRSGNDPILGDFEINDLDKTEANKELVHLFLIDVFQNKKHHHLDRYVSKKKYIQHNPHVENGYDAVAQFLATQDFNYDFIFHVMGQGNYVVTYARGVYNQQALAVFDIFRVEEGKIVEHWDNMEVIPPSSELTNSGKF